MRRERRVADARAGGLARGHQNEISLQAVDGAGLELLSMGRKTIEVSDELVPDLVSVIEGIRVCASVTGN